MNTILRVDKLRKTYGDTIAVDDISFDVREGEIFGIIGPNGAGKTTTIECLQGLRKPETGKICILGLDPQSDSHKLRDQIGTQLQQSNLPDRMKVWEALDLYASFYDQTVNWNELISQLGLEEKRNAYFSKLSGGQKQRLFIALALLHNPQLVFLDELTTGLDPQARRSIWELVSNLRTSGRTVILTTHFMDEAEYLCDRIAILDHGKIVALDTPSTLIRDLGVEERVVFYIDQPLPAGFESALSGETHVVLQGSQVTIQGNNDRNASLVREVVNLLSEQGIQFTDLRTEQANLEDVFLSMTGRKIRE
jgi:ABC-2 type transport system ATP-binding protein